MIWAYYIELSRHMWADETAKKDYFCVIAARLPRLNFSSLATRVICMDLSVFPEPER